jgi:hypothetical protein
MHHKKGKPHIKAVNDLSKKGQLLVSDAPSTLEDGKSQFTDVEITRLRNVAYLETWILKLKTDLLQDVFLNTENLIRKK